MYDNENRFTTAIFDGSSERFFHKKYPSVIMAQHMFRKELMQQDEFPNRPTLAWFPTRHDDTDNPIWDIGLIAHGLRGGRMTRVISKCPRKCCWDRNLRVPLTNR